jgi:hypothetical protein
MPVDGCDAETNGGRPFAASLLPPQEVDRMSTNLPRCAALALVPVIISASGCMYQQPMYQPYGSPYGQPMYQSAPGYSTPGTLVIPPSNTNPYPLGGTSGGSTYEDDALKSDDFRRDNGSGTGNGRFFGEDAGGVPNPQDPGGASSNDQFDRELPTP